MEDLEQKYESPEGSLREQTGEDVKIEEIHTSGSEVDEWLKT